MNYFFIAVGVLFIIYILISIKKNEFSIQESAFWMLGGLVVLFLSIFHKSLDKIASKLGIVYGTSLIFFLAILFLLLLNFRSSKRILKLNERIAKLSHKISLLELEIKEKNNEKEKRNNKKTK